MPNKTAIRSAYPWSQAVRSGLLIDVTKTPWGARFNYPVALTRAVWCQYVEAPAAQDEAKRLSEVLDTLIEKIRRLAGPGDALHYEVRVRDDTREPQAVMLKAVLAFDDDGWACLRVTLPEED